MASDMWGPHRFHTDSTLLVHVKLPRRKKSPTIYTAMGLNIIVSVLTFEESVVCGIFSLGMKIKLAGPKMNFIFFILVDKEALPLRTFMAHYIRPVMVPSVQHERKPIQGRKTTEGKREREKEEEYI